MTTKVPSTMLQNMPSGAGTTPRPLPEKLGEIVSVRDFGAVGDGVTDDTAAINAALLHMTSSGRRGVLFFDDGDFLTSAPLLCQGYAVRMVGRGPLATRILASHTDGEVIRFYGDFQGASHMTISSTGARASHTDGVDTNIGIRHEALESGSGLARNGVYENLMIENQPGHGMVFVAIINYTEVRHCVITNNGGHGVAVDNGTITGRGTKVVSGIFAIRQTSCNENEGHGFFGGTENQNTNRSFRITIDNCEIGRNAYVPAKRYSNNQIHLFGTNHLVLNSASGCASPVTEEANTGMIFIAGRGNVLLANRALDCVHAVEVGNYDEWPTQGIDVLHQSIAGSEQSDVDPAVIVDQDARGVRVQADESTATIALIDPDTREINGVPRIRRQCGFQVVTNSTTLVDADELYLPLRRRVRVHFRCFLLFDGPSAAGIKFAMTAPTDASLTYGPEGNIRIDPNGNIIVSNPRSGGAIPTATAGVGTFRTMTIVGHVITNGTAGNLQLQFAQNTADAGDTRILGASCIEAVIC